MNAQLKHKKRRKETTLPGEDSKCNICGEQASGYNFDVLSCASCKVFFRRNIFNTSLQCQSGTTQCDVFGVLNRKACKYCRLQKCLQAGMKPELITPYEKLILRSNYSGRQHKNKKMFERKEEVSSIAEGLNTQSEPSPSFSSMLRMDDGTKSEAFEIPSISPSKVTPLGTIPTHANMSSTRNPYFPEQAPVQFEEFPPWFSIDVQDVEYVFNEECLNEPSPSVTSLYPISFNSCISSSAAGSLDNVNLSPQPSPTQNDEGMLERIFQDYSKIITVAAARILQPFTEQEVYQYQQVPKCLESSYNDHEVITRRMVSALKTVPQFMCLSRQAQIYLLKKSISNMLFMSMTSNYDADTHTFNIPYTNNDKVETYRLDFEGRLRKLRESLLPCNETISRPINTEWDSSTIPLCCFYHSTSIFLSHLRFKFGLWRIQEPSVATASPSFFPSSQAHASMRFSLEDPEQDHVIKFLSVIHHIMTRIQAITDKDSILVVAMCLLMMFQHTQPELVNNHRCGIYSATDKHFIERTHEELMWFITRYAKNRWSTKTMSPSTVEKGHPKPTSHATRTFADALLEERLHNLWTVFDLIVPMKEFHTLQSQFLRRNLLTPLMQEFTPSTMTSTPGSSNNVC